MKERIKKLLASKSFEDVYIGLSLFDKLPRRECLKILRELKGESCSFYSYRIKLNLEEGQKKIHYWIYSRKILLLYNPGKRCNDRYALYV